MPGILAPCFIVAWKGFLGGWGFDPLFGSVGFHRAMRNQADPQ
jgi:hypothetical protein